MNPTIMRIDAYPADWQESWHRGLSELRTEFPKANIYALIEGVLNEACYTLLKRSGSLPFIALYANTPSADEETLCVSPILVEYLEPARRTWAALLKKTNGLPALSIIVTPESLAQLARRLAPWCIVDAADHALALSFADTRILPELFDVLSPQQLAQFCGPAQHWQYLTRSAKWQKLPLPKIGGNNLAAADAVILSDEQCGQLMAASEPDNVLFQLRRSASGLIDCHTPAHAHELVRYWLDCANHAQIDGSSERFNLCHMGLTYPHLKHSLPVSTWRAEASRPSTYDALHTIWVESVNV
ncbi:DUF4123 domain-containing protein [Janthinobacterium sp. 17J80-10]|uniref:DUF4123 domain-containing protein n=1 Tax=Janthinobacterium sp. 17J80-10 TaxID=2497863 RepID=UPI0010054672|nr:DUF4123 domain-containing protein [Janthinobacterium sp. 17J80-10]QAU35320.1 DUF4123 domain-containing protein [Janthinobacterium sp. 17J80-10]